MSEWRLRLEVPVTVEAEDLDEAKAQALYDLAFGHISTAEARITDWEES